MDAKRAARKSGLTYLVRKGGLEPPWVSPPDPKSVCGFPNTRILGLFQSH